MPLELTFGASDVRILAEETAYQGYFQIRKLTLQYRAFNGGWVAPQVREVFERATCSGVPRATMRPPVSPASGPRSRR